VCDARGRHGRLLGSIRMDNTNGLEDLSFLYCKWLPSGRGIWFKWNDALFTLRVP
jgi:hypothetical protein